MSEDGEGDTQRERAGGKGDLNIGRLVLRSDYINTYAEEGKHLGSMDIYRVMDLCLCVGCIGFWWGSLFAEPQPDGLFNSASL